MLGGSHVEAANPRFINSRTTRCLPASPAQRQPIHSANGLGLPATACIGQRKGKCSLFYFRGACRTNTSRRKTDLTPATTHPYFPPPATDIAIGPPSLSRVLEHEREVVRGGSN